MSTCNVIKLYSLLWSKIPCHLLALWTLIISIIYTSLKTHHRDIVFFTSTCIISMRRVDFFCVTKLPKVGSDGKELYPHVRAVSSLLQYFVLWATYDKNATSHWYVIREKRSFNCYRFRHIWIFLEETAPEFSLHYMIKFLFQKQITGNVYQTLVTLGDMVSGFSGTKNGLLDTWCIFCSRWEEQFRKRNATHSNDGWCHWQLILPGSTESHSKSKTLKVLVRFQAVMVLVFYANSPKLKFVLQ
jgi:hypothetical protein